MSEKELIQKILDGSSEAFKTMVEQYQDKVISTCMGFLHNLEDAEDLAQEVFIEVFLSMHKFRHESSFSTWIYRITVNKSLNHIRKNKIRKLVKSFEDFFRGNDEILNLPADNSSLANNKIDDYERLQILDKAINGLPKNQRIAFTLHKYNELPYKKISDIMNMSHSSVESLIHRAKQNLQKKLVNYYHENY